ncbi:hypothetical protein [Flavobacterium sp. AJR]|jgi:hypothetical protein|uniref:hypothetical protein n=1 Tax=Flavobacterium sp. AJR TaxID=1979369 RepID=UPI000A3D7BB1|nr:hypothetical protein [Flavobacterium sp. AJR]OUL59985.1 hypothetical protein B8T70_22710 [Flavobacterium sp. AJR]
MAKLEEISEKIQRIKKNISAYEKLRNTCLKLSVYYYREGNTVMNDCMKLRLSKIKSRLYNLHSELIPIEKERLQLLNQQPKIIIRETITLKIKNYESWMH